MRIAQGRDYIVYRLIGGSLTSPAAVRGHEVLFTEALPQTDVRYAVTPRGMKERILLKSPLAATTISYGVETNLSVTAQAEGLVFRRPSGEPVFFVPNAFAVDAQGRRAPNLPYALTTVGDRTQVSVTLPALTGLVYPVEIDPPTFTSFSGDGYIWQNGSPWTAVRGATSGGLADYQNTLGDVSSTYNGPDYTIERMFFAFDTGEIPDSATLSSAQLKFTAASTYGTFTNTRVHAVQSTQASVWKLTTTDYPALEAVSQGSLDIGTTLGLKTLPLNTSVVNVFGPTKLALRTDQDLSNVPPTSNGGWSIYTSESTPANQPVLEITYTDIPDPSAVLANEQGLGVQPNGNYYGSGNESANLLNGN
ncbi:MAG: hypothetical protein HYR55_16465, partial [Acidobacteria bacterium]|nr:hypothetical protein [Acidobacteriota bacterium]